MLMLTSRHNDIVNEYKRALSLKDQEIVILKDNVEALKFELQELLYAKQTPPDGKPVGGLRGWRNAKAEFDTRQRAALVSKSRLRANHNHQSD